ncbi:probable glucuronoxylan glucuronosyltransferase IRX7 [Cucurbita maxima]|uniref:Probable glucuronoxylan glucuronosyltransferase IRX7 n=1 Tax=Cucurbita maxima TaxID=3661 RepID=A0A6J1K1K0_CUCMA|nr:probable glucuronoxylan glucuronosyltransferase IRX7 [Cucurbita maxima]
MVESKLFPRRKGFYVKMKLFHHKNGGRAQEQSFFIKYYKWVLSLSLSLYLFTSYYITHNHEPPPITKTHLPNPISKLASRALIESSHDKFLHQVQEYQVLKVFVYDLPSKYNVDWTTNERCSNHLFASEVAIHRALMNSSYRTFDPLAADFFFVPVYVSCNFSTINGFPAIGHARSLIASAVAFISSHYPFWNRTNGSDHVFVASHDFASCFRTMEDVAIADGVPSFLKNSIILQTFGVNYKHPCQDVEHVVIPPYISPVSVRATLEKSPVTGRRDIFAFFRGKMEVNPKNVSGRYYSKKVRTMIWRKFNGDRGFYLQRHRFAGYQSEIARSVFCLCPLGWAPWSPRLVESVALGCVPVIIADGIRLPFPTAVNWAEISITVAEKDIGKLGEILEHVAASNLSTIQKNLWDPRNRRALLFHDQLEEGDATWQVVHALSEKLDRSYRRSRVSKQ